MWLRVLVPSGYGNSYFVVMLVDVIVLNDLNRGYLLYTLILIGSFVLFHFFIFEFLINFLEHIYQ